MLFKIPTLAIVVGLLLLLALFYLIGFKIRRHQEKIGRMQNTTDIGSIEGALLGLFAFFLAFTFSMANSRFDHRRETIVQEANAISTALARADLYPDSIRQPLRQSFKAYIQARIAYFEAGISKASNQMALQQAAVVYQQIWDTCVKYVTVPEFETPTRLMIPALNAMSDAVTTRDASKNAQVPESILWVLFSLGILSSFVVGFGTRSESVNYIVASSFILMVSISIYLIIDLDRPRRGLITANEANQKIIELLEDNVPNNAIDAKP